MAFLISKKLNSIPNVHQRENRACYNLANPQFCYLELVTSIVNEILAAIQLSKRFINMEREWYYPIEKTVWDENWEGIGSFFTVDCSVKKEKFQENHPGWNIRGYSGWGHAGANIEIEILVSDDMIVGPYHNLIEAELYNVVAHETHHLTQYMAPFQRPDCPLIMSSRERQTHYEYFVSSLEVPAFIIGFRAESIITGKKTDVLMDEYLLNQEEAKLITASERKKIKSVWLEYTAWENKDVSNIF